MSYAGPNGDLLFEAGASGHHVRDLRDDKNRFNDQCAFRDLSTLLDKERDGPEYSAPSKTHIFDDCFQATRSAGLLLTASSIF